MVAESLRVSGQYRPIVVNRGTLTGRPNDRRHLVVPPALDASALWRDHLFALGVEMSVAAADAVAAGAVRRVPQDDRLATWEPAFDSEPLYRPELLELP